MRERNALNLAEKIHENLQSEPGCPDCGRSSNANFSVPFPVTLVKLQEQHERILRQIEICRKNMKITDPIEGGRRFGFGKLTIRSFARLRELVDAHQREEERFLVPIVEEYLDSSASKNMCHEHKEISQSLQQLSQKSSKVKTRAALRSATLESTTRFEDMAREQFSREENVIYWFASLCLDNRIKRSRPS